MLRDSHEHAINGTVQRLKGNSHAIRASSLVELADESLQDDGTIGGTEDGSKLENTDREVIVNFNKRKTEIFYEPREKGKLMADDQNSKFSSSCLFDLICLSRISKNENANRRFEF